MSNFASTASGSNTSAYIRAQQEKRDQLAADTEAFLANGGQIQQLEHSPDVFAKTGELPSEIERKNRARKRGENSHHWQKHGAAQYRERQAIAKNKAKKKAAA